MELFSSAIHLICIYKRETGGDGNETQEAALYSFTRGAAAVIVWRGVC